MPTKTKTETASAAPEVREESDYTFNVLAAYSDACDTIDELLDASKAMRHSLENVDFSRLPGVYDSIPFDQLEAAIAHATGEKRNE